VKIPHQEATSCPRMAMSAECTEFLQQCLLFDIEVNERNRIYSIGAVFQGEKFQLSSGGEIEDKQLQAFDEFAAGAVFILGHNILRHDIPRLQERAPSLIFLHKPAIDTLYLSPLAYPENPYHRLVKDYKLVRDSINNPSEDALLAGRVFCEQWQAFCEPVTGKREVLLSIVPAGRIQKISLSFCRVQAIWQKRFMPVLILL